MWAFKSMLILASLWSCLLSQSEACRGVRFHRVDGAPDCVSSQFFRIINGICGAEMCAMACAPLATCQAFASLSGCQCKLFLFDACSHRVQSFQNACPHLTTVYVRSLSGAAPGSLCPLGYSRQWYGTSYKLVNALNFNWTDVKAACSTNGGLAKFADAIDAEEIQHLLSIRSAGVTYYIGGRQTVANASDLKANWVWDACNVTMSRTIWQSGQPSDGLPHRGCATLYSGYSSGLDDDYCSTRGYSYICECQSVF